VAVGNIGPVIVASLTSGTISNNWLLSILPHAMSLETSLLDVVCGAYLLSGGLFTIAAIEEGRRIKRNEKSIL
jgi:hypothetical protein